ncbi:MAG: Gfo/Idh/MocA family oxidoreductase [Calditrichia bacterium]
MINVGVIGAGYWGPNIIRNFMINPDTNVVMVCDLQEERLEKVSVAYPHIKTTTDANDLITSGELDLIAVCTPVSTHYQLAKEILSNKKHLLIEKPMTATAAEAEELNKIANAMNVKIFVDHTFLFTPAVQKIKEWINNGELGDLLYFDSVRINLGLFQHDVSVIWDLAVHDMSILTYLISNKPKNLSATGSAHYNQSIHDMAYLSLQYNNNFIAHIHVNWLSPVKVRKCLIAGTKKMIVWDDTLADEKIKIYDKGIDVIKNDNDIYELLIQYRSGDMVSPRLPNREALSVEVQNIVDVLKNKAEPISDGHLGAEVVKMIELADSSMKKNGTPVHFEN